MRQLIPILFAPLLLACPGSEPEPQDKTWEVVHRDLTGALLSVWGSSSTDVWAVGADALDGSGPTVIHYDGESWERMATGEAQGNLWWVFGFDEGPVYMGGEGGVILRYEGGEFVKMATPSGETVFGIWGASADDVWAVGGASDSAGGFAWRLTGDGASWTPEPTLPVDVTSGAAVWKVFGTSRDDAWLVGSNGVALHWNGSALAQGETGIGTSLFTVHAADGRYAAVGGTASGILVEYEDGAWRNVTPEQDPPPGLSGVVLGEDDFGVAVGSFGAVYTRSDEGWSREETGFNLPWTVHGAWIDEKSCIWAVGGQVLSPPFRSGLLLHRGAPIASQGL